MPSNLKRSERRSRPPRQFNKPRVVFEGHGEWYGKTTIVPASTLITIYTGMGSAIDDVIGVLIAKNRGLPATIPDNGYDSDGDVDTTLRGRSWKLSGHRRIYRNYEEVPNLILLPPDDLTVSKKSVTVPRPTSLESLLRKYRGCDCHWAACTIMR